MTRFRRPQTTIGRTPYALRMTYPALITPENTQAIFREIQRWADALPYPNQGTFVPYFLEYKPEEPQVEWDVNLVLLMQEKFLTDIMPTGTWLVHAGLSPTEAPAGAVGIDAKLLVKGPNLVTATNPYESIGYMDGEAIRVLDDLEIDFTAETFDPTYKWFLPPVDGGLMSSKPSSFNLIVIDRAEDDITITGSARAATIEDPDVGPDLAVEDIPSYLYVWAYRLSDGYSIPTSIEDVTPS